MPLHTLPLAMNFTHHQITIIGLGLAFLALVAPLAAAGTLLIYNPGHWRLRAIKIGALLLAGAAVVALFTVPPALESRRLQRWAAAKAQAEAAARAGRFEEMRQALDAADAERGRADYVAELLVAPEPARLPGAALQRLVVDCSRDAQAEGAQPRLDQLREAIAHGRAELVDAFQRGHAGCPPAQAEAWRRAVREAVITLAPYVSRYDPPGQQRLREAQAEALAVLVGHDTALLEQRGDHFGCSGYSGGPMLGAQAFPRCTLLSRLVADGHREAVLRLLPIVEDAPGQVGPLVAALLRGDAKAAVAALDAAPAAMLPMLPRLFAIAEAEPLAALINARELSVPWATEAQGEAAYRNQSALRALFEAAYSRDAGQAQWRFIEIALRLFPRAEALDPALYRSYFERLPASDARVAALVRALQRAGVSCSRLSEAIHPELRSEPEAAAYRALAGCPLALKTADNSAHSRLFLVL